MIRKKIKYYITEPLINPLKVKGKQKIFVIGRNKTGTTSLRREFEAANFIVGNQRRAEKLGIDYAKGNFNAIINYCKTAQVFQDVPFSWPNTYKYLHEAFPNAKFILSYRDSPEQWYNSITKFHAKKFGNGKIPTSHQLKNATYSYPGFMWFANQTVYNTPADDPYNKEIMIQNYLKHNHDVKKYFDKSENFLAINLTDQNAYQSFCNFIGIEQHKESFFWANKTKDIQTNS